MGELLSKLTWKIKVSWLRRWKRHLTSKWSVKFPSFRLIASQQTIRKPLTSNNWKSYFSSRLPSKQGLHNKTLLLLRSLIHGSDAIWNAGTYQKESWQQLIWRSTLFSVSRFCRLLIHDVSALIFACDWLFYCYLYSRENRKSSKVPQLHLDLAQHRRFAP